MPDKESTNAATAATHLDQPQMQVPEQVRRKLSDLDIQHSHQLLSAANASGNHLRQYLDIEPAELDRILATVREATAPSVVEDAAIVVPPALQSFGARPPTSAMLARSAALPIAGGGELAVTLPPSVDLSKQMPPIRDQGRRGTCVAFAESALHEFAEGSSAYFSARDLYQLTKGIDGMPDQCGTYLSKAAEVLETGQLRESDYPYDGSVGCNEYGAPPVASTRTSIRLVALAAKDVIGIKAALAQGRPVAFSVPLYGAFVTGDTRLRGRVVMPIDGEPSIGGHAMCIVGYVDDGPENSTPTPGGGFFILRNSWGTDRWGTQCQTGPGYGTMPYAYVALYAWEAFTLREASKKFIGDVDTAAATQRGTPHRAVDVNEVGMDGFRLESRRGELVIRISERVLMQHANAPSVSGVAPSLAAAAPPIRLVSVRADPRSGAESGWTIREDFAPSFRNVCARIRALGAPAVSSGGIRDLGEPATAGRSKTSLHYTGRAIDLFLKAGMQSLTDSYVVVRDGGTDTHPMWQVCGVSTSPNTADPMFDPSLLRTGTLAAAIWKKGAAGPGYTESPRACTYFSITDLLMHEGWVRIPSRTDWKTTYESLEWWHFQDQNQLVSGVSKFGDELKKVWPTAAVDASELALDAVWTNQSFQST